MLMSWIPSPNEGRSTIRHLLDISFEGKTYPEQLIAANVIVPQVPDTWSDANFCVDSGDHWGLVARVRGNLWRMADNEEQGLSEAQIRERLSEKLLRHSGGQVFDEIQIDALSPYRLQQRCAATFLIGHIALAGDAAHLCNPFGAFGLSSGLLDAAALADALRAIHDGKASDGILEH